MAAANRMASDREVSESAVPVNECQTGNTDGRINWSGRFDFILSCIGYAIGLSNIWRFPYICYKHGGGAFLIPYFLMMAVCGIPLILLETGAAQFCSLGPISMWKMSPLFKGLGWAMTAVAIYWTVYYNVILAWVIRYFFASMTNVLPWSTCGKGFSVFCNDVLFSTTHFFNSTEEPGRHVNLVVDGTTYKLIRNSSALSCVASASYTNHSQSGAYDCNITSIDKRHLSAVGIKLTSPAEEYFDKVLLRKSDGIEDSSAPLWDIALCLLLAWISVFLCIAKGIKSSGKVVYVTAIVPYILLTVFVVRGALLDGAADGVFFYMKPEWSKLTSVHMWKDAASQVFYSVGVSFGSLQAMASYNKFKNNILRDVIVLAAIDCLTSIFAGFAVFSMIGYIAKQNGLRVQDAVTSGPGLVFVAYPDGISTLPLPQLWSVLFFMMLFTLGLDSQFATCEGVITGLVDEFPKLRQTRFRRVCFTACFCTIMFLLGLSMTTKAGIYWVTLLDEYSVGTSVCVIAVIELVAIIYVYGAHRFIGDLEQMLGRQHIAMRVYFLSCWCLLTPATLLVINVYRGVEYAPLTLGTYSYPRWADTIGWLMIASSIVLIPIWTAVLLLRNKRLRPMFPRLIRPTHDWGPALTENREEYARRDQGAFWPVVIRGLAFRHTDSKLVLKSSNDTPI